MDGGGPTNGAAWTGNPVCVTGMHRSGTSLVAGLLHRHGLWLGDEADMMPANPYNPEGYFENDRVVQISDAVLAAFDGKWSSPPALAGNWTQDPRLARLKTKARTLGESLGAGHAAWGFKDPRAALTLPFWRAVWGELAVVVTIRNPLETARSLHRRDGMPLEEGIALWGVHYRSILNLTTRDTRVVVGYEAMCADPIGSARALLAHVSGLRELDDAAARDTVRPALRHHRETVADLHGHGVASDVLDLYTQLQAEAVNPERATDEPLSVALRGLPAAIAGLDRAIRDVHVDLERLAAVVSRLEGEVIRMSSPPAHSEDAAPAPAEVTTNGRRE